MKPGKQRDRRVEFPERYVPADGSLLVDPKIGYLIAGFTDKGDVARPGERFYNAVWSRDLSGTCSSGAHAKCAHRPGGGQEHGVTCTGADGEPHTWRCGCECHGHTYEPPPAPPLGQLELFPGLVPA